MALLPAALDGERRTAFLFDLDGTITATELLPLIAREIGLGEDMAAATRRAMSGLEPFPDSLRARVELLSEIPISTVVEIVKSAPLHGRLVDWIHQNRDSCWVVTSNLDCWVNPLIEDLGLRGFSSSGHLVDGRVHIDDVLAKQDVLREFPGMRTVMVGDGANDAEILAEADVGVANALRYPVPPVVLEVADYLVQREEALCRLLSRL